MRAPGSKTPWAVIAVAAGLALLFAAFVFGVPGILGRVWQGRMTDTLTRAEQIHGAIELMALDTATGWPADAGIKSVTELKAVLVKKGYLSEDELQKLRFEDFEIGNVSKSDPGDTVLLRSSPDKRGVLIFQKDGDAAIPRLRPRAPRPGNDPPREPAYLPQR